MHQFLFIIFGIYEQPLDRTEWLITASIFMEDYSKFRGLLIPNLNLKMHSNIICYTLRMPPCLHCKVPFAKKIPRLAVLTRQNIEITEQGGGLVRFTSMFSGEV